MLNHIKEARESKDLTQEQAAESLGVHPNTVRGWESGAFKPTGKYLVKLSKLYGCSPEYLLGYTDDPKGTCCAI